MVVAPVRMPLRQLVMLHQDQLTLREKATLLDIIHVMTRCHDGQKRATEEDYDEHLSATYSVLRSLGLPFPALAASLLHDAIEDCYEIDYAYLVAKFKPKRIADLVHAVTKYNEQTYFQQMERAVLDLDLWESIFVKDADRLHNLATVDGFSDLSRRIRFCEETLGPLAELNLVCRPKIPPRFLLAFEELFETIVALAQEKLSSNRQLLAE